MLNIDIPQRDNLELHHAVFDINGTLATDGLIAPGVADRLHMLQDQLSIHLLSAGTHGNISSLEHTLGFPIHLIQNGDEKKRYVQQLGPANVVALGNGVNDCEMLRIASIGIAIMGSEGLASCTLQAADVLVASPADALDLLLKPKRLIATLRG